MLLVVTCGGLAEALVRELSRGRIAAFSAGNRPHAEQRRAFEHVATGLANRIASGRRYRLFVSGWKVRNRLGLDDDGRLCLGTERGTIADGGGCFQHSMTDHDGVW